MRTPALEVTHDTASCRKKFDRKNITLSVIVSRFNRHNSTIFWRKFNTY